MVTEEGSDLMRRMKNWAFALLTFLLVLGAIEAMAWLTQTLFYDEGAGSRPPRTRLLASSNEAEAVVHPFYGNVRDLKFHDLNIASHERECALVVGLLGGSVARGVSTEFRLALLRHVASLGTGVWPVWVDLAHDGYAQPQQAHALVNKLAGGVRFDIVVSLDGYNEVHRPSGGWFPLFPITWYSVIGLTVEQRVAAMRILALRTEQEALFAGRGGIYRSATFGLLRRWRLDRIEHLIVRRHHDLFEAGNASYSLEKHGPRQQTYTRDELRRTAAESWYWGAWLLASLARHHGAEYYHFLQPNQWVPGTKPLTAEELAFDAPTAEEVRSTYPLLAEYGRRLREQDIEFFDLSHIYADNRETLYVDGCCHVNRRGNELLAAAMLRRIIEGGGGAVRAESKNQSCLTRYRSAVALVETGEYGEPAVRSVFNIYRKGRTLVYLKRHCVVDDIEDSFLLQFTRSEGSVGEGAFRFSRHGAILDGETCVAIVRLEDGLIHMRTGQFREGWGDTWSVELDIAGLDAPLTST